MSKGCAAGEPTTPEQRMAEELHLMKTAGIIEVAYLNPNVSEWIDHWEGRTVNAETEIAAAYAYALHLAEALRSKYFPENEVWKPLDNLVGLLTQIDNMTSCLVKEPSSPA